MGKCNRNISLAPFKRGNVVTKKVKETSPFTHTQLSLATSLRGNVMMGEKEGWGGNP